MRFRDLLAMVEAVDGAGGGGEEWHVAEESGRDDVAVEIKRGNGRHQFLSFLRMTLSENRCTLFGVMLFAPRRP